MKKPVDFLNRFRLDEISIVEKTEIDPLMPTYFQDYERKHDFGPLHLRERRRPYIKCQLPQDRFEELVEITDEWFELMQDPECARLVMEARFINRLKRGK